MTWLMVETMPPSNCTSSAHPSRPAMGHVSSIARVLAIFVISVIQPQWAQAQKVRISNLADVDFGLISNLQAEARRSQNICLYSSGTAGAYSVSASGSGAGASFALSNGASTLPYDVEWSDSSGLSSGSQLTPVVPLTGQTSSASHQFCNSGPTSSASMTIVFRAADLSQAREGSYSGTLTFLIAAE